MHVSQGLVAILFLIVLYTVVAVAIGYGTFGTPIVFPKPDDNPGEPASFGVTWTGLNNAPLETSSSVVDETETKEEAPVLKANIPTSFADLLSIPAEMEDVTNNRTLPLPFTLNDEHREFFKTILDNFQHQQHKEAIEFRIKGWLLQHFFASVPRNRPKSLLLTTPVINDELELAVEQYNAVLSASADISLEKRQKGLQTLLHSWQVYLAPFQDAHMDSLLQDLYNALQSSKSLLQDNQILERYHALLWKTNKIQFKSGQEMKQFTTPSKLIAMQVHHELSHPKFKFDSIALQRILEQCVL
jgi:hypothetical protein